MTIPLFHVDAFADELFKGNPAAVCPLESWLTDNTMQAIAAENNLSETAFFVKHDDVYNLRWFTPVKEVNLCGHATLATAYVLFNSLGYTNEAIYFSTRSGILAVRKDISGLLTMDFPADIISDTVESDYFSVITSAMAIQSLGIYKGKTDYLIELSSEDEVKKVQPDFTLLKKVPARGIIITAKGDKADFVSRFFAPQAGINEDPVTGSAHTTLTPFWAKKLGKTKLTAHQLSARGGKLECLIRGDRVLISGQCKLYLAGEIYL
jgi:PhzF family phenazine biosynthesis protein